MPPSPRLAAEPAIETADVRRIGLGRRNTSLVLGNQMMLKVHRRVEAGKDPEVEVLRFLTEKAHFTSSPSLLGVVEHVDPGENRTVLAILQTYVHNQGDARGWMIDAFKRSFEAAALTGGQESRAGHGEFAAYAPHMRRLGACTAGMHKALAAPCADPAFGSEELTFNDVREAAEAANVLAERGFKRLGKIAAAFSGDKRAAAKRLLARHQECLSLIGELIHNPQGAIKIRSHGNYRLGRLLVVRDDFMIVDFGGGRQPFDHRRAKTSPLRDVASMLSSFAHAVAAATQDLARMVPDSAMATARLREELIEFSEIFIRAYMEAARGSPIWIEDGGTRRRLLTLYLLHELFRDVDSESEKRPERLEVSIDSLNTLLDRVGSADLKH
ncbi:MAG: hypothetical protein L0Y50_14040 [Beijerinckiaceae bacterium]|nr:hypothetical protein [Beijerinckiaceae bacterium]